MSQIVIRVIGRPAPKGSKRLVTHGRGGRKLDRPLLLDDCTRTKQWSTCVAEAAIEALRGHTPFAGQALHVELVFKMRRPNGHYGTGRNAGKIKPSAPRFPAVKPDVDKLQRATLDPLSGVVYDDDARITEILARKRYARLGEPEGAEIRITTQGDDQ